MRTVVFVSNRTAITAETMGHSLLGQFEGHRFSEQTHPYVDTPEKAEALADKLRVSWETGEHRPIVFSTLADPATREPILRSGALVIDLFECFLGDLTGELGAEPHQTTGRSHRISDLSSYEGRIEAINYTLAHDDGADIRHYDHADVILLGVSCTAKTPTSLYLALQFSLRAANYPITPEDLEYEGLPKFLRPYRNRLFGLITDPDRLHQIRSQRRPDSRYASLDQCHYEIRQVEAMYMAERIPYVNSTLMSVEEIATTIVQRSGLRRHGF